MVALSAHFGWGDMSEADPAGYQWHRNAGGVLLALGVCLAVLGFLFLWFATKSSLLLTILALVFGNYGFRHLERAAFFKPKAPIVHQLQLFSSALKSGGDVSVLLEIHYPSEKDSPYTLERIKAFLQRTLNEQLSMIDALPANPYTEIDRILKQQIEPLSAELGLGKVGIQTIDVKRSGVLEASPSKSLKFPRS